MIVERKGDVRMIPEIVATDQRRSAEVTAGLLARFAVVVSIQSEWIRRIGVEGDLSILCVEEVLAVGSLLGAGIRWCPEHTGGSQADRDRKRNQPESMKGSKEGHRRALSRNMLPVSSVA